MILISHRGNTNGSLPKHENHPDYIKNALNQGFDVEVDLWVKDTKFHLGHDYPQYQIEFTFLLLKGLWIHCKNYYALQSLIPTNLNYFYHTDQDYVLTSKNYIWAYPSKPGGKYTICVMPENNNSPTSGFDGICSDYISKYKNDSTNSLRP